MAMRAVHLRDVPHTMVVRVCMTAERSHGRRFGPATRNKSRASSASDQPTIRAITTGRAVTRQVVTFPITIDWKKVPVGLYEGETENTSVVTGWPVAA
jgi:hypothetical protein